MGSSIAFAAAFAASAIQSATPTSEAPLKPTGPWNVEYADRMCLLSREFGEGDAKVMLAFRPGMFSDQMRLVVIKLASTGATARGAARLSLDGGAPIEAYFIEGHNKAEGIRATAIDLKESSLAPLKTAIQLRIQAGKVDITVAPTAVPAAMKALETCQKDLLVTWGMDAAVVASIATFPSVPGGVIGLFSTNDYPQSAIMNNEQGTSSVRFWVSTEGKVRDCEVVESSRSLALDRETCAVIRRGRFEPARTHSGEPVESIGFYRVRWEIP